MLNVAFAILKEKSGINLRALTLDLDLPTSTFQPRLPTSTFQPRPSNLDPRPKNKLLMLFCKYVFCCAVKEAGLLGRGKAALFGFYYKSGKGVEVSLRYWQIFFFPFEQSETWHVTLVAICATADRSAGFHCLQKMTKKIIFTQIASSGLWAWCISVHFILILDNLIHFIVHFILILDIFYRTKIN